VRIDDVPGLFDDERIVVLTAEVSEAAIDGLTPAEAEHVARAIDKRKREFATGRALVRHAMQKLGLLPGELLNGDDRAPIWPEGVSGSITHCDTRAVVALGRRSEVGTLGLDIEHRGELRQELWRPVFLPAEIEAIEREPERDRGRLALVMFGAKEALYKAQYGWSKTFMGFSALHVAIEREGASHGALACTFQIDVPPFDAGTVVRGRYRLDAFATGEVASAIQIVR
jgi:4'-phosphopantetheinyl transferase EntD